MARPPRDTTPSIHHVIVGATSDEDYFLDEADRWTWIRRFVRTLDRFGWTCISVCELTTHVHALVDIPDESISLGMHYLNSFYGTYFNETKTRRGALIRSRFWSKPVIDDEQLLETYRYIARNPVKAGLCVRPEDWLWSGFSTSCGLAQTFPFVDASVVCATLGSTGADAPHALLALAQD